MEGRQDPVRKSSIVPSPQIGPRQVVYEDRNRTIHRVTADFGTFSKEYFVVEAGQRVGLVVVQGESVLLVRQYRLLLDGLSWEIPGGGVNEGETPEAAAIRECLEETGVLCRNLRPLLSYQPGLDSFHNPTHIFYTDEHVVATEPDPNPREVWEHHWISVSEGICMISDGRIVDSLSVVALFAYKEQM